MFMFSSNSQVEILIASVMVLGDEAFARWLGHEGGSLLDATSLLIKEAPARCLALSLPCEDTTH